MARFVLLLAVLVVAGCGSHQSVRPDPAAKIAAARSTLAAALVSANGDTAKMQRATDRYLETLNSVKPQVGARELMRELGKDRAGVRSFCLPCSLSLGRESSRLMDEVLAGG